MDCNDMGYMLVYDRSGHFTKIGHEKTVELCNKSIEEGIGLADIIRKEIVHDLKLIKFMDDDE